MNRVEIINALTDILHKSFHVPKDLCTPDFYDLPLTSERFHFDGGLLLYFFFEAEKHFSIRIPQGRLDDYRFSSISGMAQIIEECLHDG